MTNSTFNPLLTTPATDKLLSSGTPDALFRLRVGRNGMEEAPDAVRLLVQMDEDRDVWAQLEVSDTGRFGNVWCSPDGWISFNIDPTTDATKLAELLDNPAFGSLMLAWLACREAGQGAHANGFLNQIERMLDSLPCFEPSAA